MVYYLHRQYHLCHRRDRDHLRQNRQNRQNLQQWPTRCRTRHPQM